MFKIGQEILCSDILSHYLSLTFYEYNMQI